MWQTLTPDGFILALRHSNGIWTATCLAERAEADTAEEAIRRVLITDDPVPDEEKERWIAALVADLEAAPTED